MRFFPSPAEVVLQSDSLYLNCEPLMTFDLVSPDGCWSILSAVRARLNRQPTQPPQRSLVSHGIENGDQIFQYSDNSVVMIPTLDAPARAEFTTFSRLDEDTYSHLNSFCVFTIRGGRQIALAFSPCEGDVIDVFPFDYPAGRPARFAYWDATQQFRVVEASSGEKGSFRTLATGKLERGQPLTIFVHDAGVMRAKVTLHDWSAQASTDLSPTAGWMVPMNAIEFFRIGKSENGPVAIYVTLAATSVGRGWDSVGHRAGTYRNRISIEIPRQE
jgi:hypothetical protein